MGFDIWDTTVHDLPDQQKRLQSAAQAKTTPTEVDRNAQTGIFSGSGRKPYHTTLESCTCKDFSIRKLPCKHMYRLAIELGLIDKPVKSGLSDADYFSIVNSLDDDAQHLLYTLAYERLYREPPTYELRRRTSAEDSLLSSGLCVETVGDYSSCSLTTLSKKDISSILESTGIVPNENILKSGSRWKGVYKYIQALYESSPDLIRQEFIIIDFTPQSYSNRHKVHRRLHNKFDPSPARGEPFILGIHAKMPSDTALEK